VSRDRTSSARSALAAPAGGVGEVRREARLASAGRSADEDAAAVVHGRHLRSPDRVDEPELRRSAQPSTAQGLGLKGSALHREARPWHNLPDGCGRNLPERAREIERSARSVDAGGGGHRPHGASAGIRAPCERDRRRGACRAAARARSGFMRRDARASAPAPGLGTRIPWGRGGLERSMPWRHWGGWAALGARHPRGARARAWPRAWWRGYTEGSPMSATCRHGATMTGCSAAW
jgi:hypothetical protein